MKRAVFLDRDGTLNYDVGYLSKLEDIYIFDGVVDSLKRLKESGFLNIIVTNQSGIARGFLNLSNLKTIHEKFLNLLSFDGECLIDDVFFSPYHIDGLLYILYTLKRCYYFILTKSRVLLKIQFYCKLSLKTPLQ